MLGCEGKLTHLGLDRAPARSTLSDANSKRSYLFFETIYFELLQQYHSFISDSRLRGLSIRNLKIIDSTTIRLFSDFVTRMKDNAVFHVSKVITDNTKKKNAKGILKEQYITVGYKNIKGETVRLKLRRIIYKAEDGKIYVFITNSFTLAAAQIALIYKTRWMIEILFKQIKQNFPLRYFWGNSENAIKMQVYCVLIAQLLMIVIRKKAATKKSFANMITVIRLHLMSYVELFEFIKDTYKAWRKTHNAPNAFAT
jgi:hypothetical protein